VRVHVVCRLNQARSVIASAALRRIYPNWQIFSSGIDANPSWPIPELIRDIAYFWRLDEIDLQSKRFPEDAPIQSGDFFLTADSGIYSEVSELAIPGPVYEVTSNSPLGELVATDPLDMPADQVEVELAKMTILSNFRLRDSIGRILNVSATYARNNSITTLISFLEDWLNQNNGLIIDMNWKVPNKEFWSSLGVNIQLVNFRNFASIQSTAAALKPRTLLVSKFEIDDAEQLLLSKEWLDTLEAVSENFPVMLVPPISDLLCETPTSILASIHASLYNKL